MNEAIIFFLGAMVGGMVVSAFFCLFLVNGDEAVWNLS